jgi:DNA-binding XRE family transcriptional regulator
MTDFGEALRDLRQRHGLTQQELSDAIGNELSRESIANIEAGRQAPSVRLWRSLQDRFPEDSCALHSAYESARHRPVEMRAVARRHPPQADAPSLLLGGHLVMERLEIIYNFRESRAPEEVIELRQVRASRTGVHDFGLAYAHTGSEHYEQAPEVLFGGKLISEERQVANGETLYFRRLDFGQPLHRGERHTFAMRYWAERDPEPADSIMVKMTMPTELVVLHANFWGSHRPTRIWRFGAFGDEALAPGLPTPANELPNRKAVTAAFERPEVGLTFGIAWRW